MKVFFGEGTGGLWGSSCWKLMKEWQEAEVNLKKVLTGLGLEVGSNKQVYSQSTNNTRITGA